MNRPCPRLAAAFAAVVLAACGNATENIPTGNADLSLGSGCTDDRQCLAPTPRCDKNTTRCVPCLPLADNCPKGQRCVPSGDSFACSANCQTDVDCPRGDGGAVLSCCSGHCFDLSGDAQNCGQCGGICPTPPNGAGACRGGMCGVGTCNLGFLDCDRATNNGCEINAQADDKNCGECGKVCSSGANQRSSCMAGRCVAECTPGFADCDGRADNGCEVPITTDLANCGACGAACAVKNGNAACKAGVCTVDGCNPGFGDCNQSAADGCEADLTRDLAHCGRCNAACAAANGVPACRGGSCAIDSCGAGFADCNNLYIDGCETPVASDPKNCGVCGRVCGGANSMQDCQMGACQITACSAGFADCDLSAKTGCEVNVGSDVANCGGCGKACPIVANGTPACVNAQCGIASCKFGFADCDKDPANGCEVDLLTVQNCGACGVACAAPANASAGCKGGVCGIGMCNALFGDCDGNAGNGCEKNLATDPQNCGKCGGVCALANAQSACLGGQCGVLQCNAGFADCDGMAANGCEVNLNTDLKNCGKCGNACAQNALTCTAGVCSTYPAACSTDKDQNGSNYIICAMDATGAWITANNNGGGCTYGALTICKKYGFTRVNRWGGTCGTICGYCGAFTCQSPQAKYVFGTGYTTFDSGGGDPRAGGNITCTVHWECAP